MGLGEIYQLAIAIGLGMMVGFQREGTESPIAGVRTFPLITALGFLTGLLQQTVGGWIVVGGLLAVLILRHRVRPDTSI